MNKFLPYIPIRIEPLFWILAFGLGWLYTGQLQLTLIWGFVILFSVLLHEFGHALTAIFFGQKASITLMIIGGVTKREGPPLSKWKEFLIVLNGPLAGFALSLLCWWLSFQIDGSKHPILIRTLYIGYYANLFWTIVNLFPIQPLDGGHLFMILLEGIFGVRGIKIAYFISLVLASLLTFWAFVHQELLIGALFFLFAFENYRSWRNSLQMTPEDKSVDFQNEIKEAESLYNSGDLEGSRLKLVAILEKSRSKGIIYYQTTMLLAKILNEQGHIEEAYALLEKIKKNLSLEGLMLLHSLAFKSGHLVEATKIGAQIHRDFANSDTALLNAFSHAELNEAEAAVGWLKTAISEGLENPSFVINHKRFDKIRAAPAFQSLVKQSMQN